MEAHHHRREERVRHAEAAEEQAARTAEALPAIGPQCDHALDVLLRLRRHALAGIAAADVHRHVPAQGLEARMHLRAGRARHAARLGCLGPQMLFGEHLRHGLTDRERIPHRLPVDHEDRHLARGRVLLNPGDGQAPLAFVELELHLLERDLRLAQEDPRPHRPGGVVLVADDQFELHSQSLPRESSRISPGNQGFTPCCLGESPIGRAGPGARIWVEGERMQPRPDFLKRTPPLGQAVRILLLEDDPISVEIVGTYLRRIEFADVELHSAVTAADALALLARADVDLVVADLNLPDSSGAATVQSLVQAVGCPVIAITADRDPGLRDATLACGAFEFLHKGDLTEATLMRLVRLATMQARTYRSLRESREAEAALRESEGRFRSLARFGQSALVKSEPTDLVEKAARLVFEALAVEAVAYIDTEPSASELVLRTVVAPAAPDARPGPIVCGRD